MGCIIPIVLILIFLANPVLGLVATVIVLAIASLKK
ncbi:hypothetical protein LaPh949_gp092 [Lactococcus phage 949]|uniref:Uncharacterized protein n=1 Tax=Lactococcus phage 949 TaxID=881953 RepID=E0YIX9_9CAUD|nr:hypothetical protein LaPh949_gp092 [Lactococcus phage 949]ADM73650.1 hypothetical protein [Lactococcus phage 949]